MVGWLRPAVGSGLAAGGGLHPPYKWVEDRLRVVSSGLRAGFGRSVRLKPDLLSDGYGLALFAVGCT
jgi:hypothetical protein